MWTTSSTSSPLSVKVAPGITSVSVFEALTTATLFTVRLAFAASTALGSLNSTPGPRELVTVKALSAPVCLPVRTRR